MKFVLIAVLIGVCLGSCPLYTPSATEFFLPNAGGVCSARTEDATSIKYEFTECKAGEVCPVTLGKEDKCKLVTEVPKYYNGEIGCTTNTQCISGTCTGEDVKKCGGKPLDGVCSKDEDCDVALGCTSKKCQALLGVGETCGIDTGKCKTHLVCDDGTCAKAGSKKNGDAAFAPLACSSYFTYKQDTTYNCVAGPKLKGGTGTEPKKCTSPTDKCEYELTLGDTTTIALDEGECHCGRTKSGFAYCQPGMGDNTERITKYMVYMQKDNGCHISKKFCNNAEPAKEKKEDFTKFWEAKKAYMELTQGVLFVDNEDVVRKVVSAEYYQIIQKLEEDTTTTTTDASRASLFLPLLFILAILLF